jgi:benzoyl-CoA reductase subunit C
MVTRLLPGGEAAWRRRPLADILALARDLVEDTSYPTVRRWREAGGRVLGHFQVYFPEEIAHAAEMLPVKIRGAQIEPRQADARFGSYLCSIMKTSLELALGGRIELDAFVSHPICDAARNLAAVWGRNMAYPCRILYLPQNPNSVGSAGYLRDEYARAQTLVEEVSGRRITPAALGASIAVFNENRRLLRRLYAIRRRAPWKLSVDESYALTALGAVIPREEHNELLSEVLPLVEAREAAPRDLLRVVLEGGFCEQPPLDLLRAVAQFCYVVDDDLLIGLRWLEADVAQDDDPLLALARAYLDASSYSPVQHDARKPKERMLLERIRGADAGAAILIAAKMCEPGLDEQVTYARALDAQGVPYFISEFEERMTTFEHLQIQLETFVENVIFA